MTVCQSLACDRSTIRQEMLANMQISKNRNPASVAGRGPAGNLDNFLADAEIHLFQREVMRLVYAYASLLLLLGSNVIG